MSGLVGSAAAEEVVAAESTADGTEIVQAWKSIYTGKDDYKEAKFWSTYDPVATSIWSMSYDEADSNEDLEQTIDIVSNYMSQTGMESIRDECFGVVHVLESLEIEGLWLFNGSDPEKMFGANAESSWYTWSRLGPDATNLVKQAVAKFLMPIDGKLNGTAIKDTKIF
eukprot:scaffold35279_cov206-Amphora_coffeaeformis.AAC.1